jgi:hypothetical protein
MNRLKIFFPLTLISLFVYSGMPQSVTDTPPAPIHPKKDSLIHILRNKNMHLLKSIEDKTRTYDSIHRQPDKDSSL